MIERAAASLPDDDALSAVELFPAWQSDRAYTVGERVRHDGKLYKVVQAHMAQADWTPDATLALFTEVAPPGVIPVWRQPTGAQDAYNTGDRVRYPDEDGAVYASTVDNNVWSPDVYGWEELANE
jgi:chitodextrinase